jgi:hypothetical protein
MKLVMNWIVNKVRGKNYSLCCKILNKNDEIDKMAFCFLHRFILGAESLYVLTRLSAIAGGLRKLSCQFSDNLKKVRGISPYCCCKYGRVRNFPGRKMCGNPSGESSFF